ncbi:MAG: site-specific integrase [Cyanobacteria bacterium P01_H01_bin.74]
MREIPNTALSKRRHMHTAVSSMARFLFEQVPDTLTHEAYTRIKMLYPKKPRSYEPEQHLLYEEDIPQVFAGIQRCYPQDPAKIQLMKTLITVLLETGLRVAELVTLTQPQMRFGEARQHPFITVKGKGAKVRKIPFSRAAQTAMKDYLNACQSPDLGQVFTVYHKARNEWATVKRDWVVREVAKVSRAAGIKFTAHSFRHYRITQWANNPRIPLNAVRLWAGHSSVTVTERYIHTRDEDALAAAIG